MSEQRWSPAPLEGRLQDDSVLQAVSQSLPGGAATHKNMDYWQWKHCSNPAGESIGYLAEASDPAQVVGVRAFMRWQMLGPEGDTYSCVRAVDTVTDPAFRGQGIFSKLTQLSLSEAEAKGVALVFNTPNANSAPGYLKMGWQVVGKMPLYIKPLSYMRLAAGVLNRNRRSARGAAAEERDFGIADLPDWPAASEFPGFAAMMESHEGARCSSGLRTQRNQEYLAWRYGLHPHVRYRIYCLEEQGRPVAAAVVRPNIRYGLKELVLTELWAKNADHQLMQRCLAELIKRVDADYLIAHGAASSPELAVLKKRGFLRAPKQGMTLYARPVSLKTLGTLGDTCGWDLSLGDLELF